MRILFTICARAGSKGFKNKNIKKLKGVPLVYYTLAAIKLFVEKHKNDIIVICLNTDSNDLIKQVENQSILSSIEFVKRKEELADDVTPKVNVVQDSYKQMMDIYGDFDHIIDLDITSPIRRTFDINSVIDNRDKGNYDICFSVVNSRRSPYFNMVEIKDDGFYRKVCNSNYTARQQAPKCYELNASIYDYNPAIMEKKIDKTILDYNCGISIMPDYLVLDIDSDEDLVMMDVLFDYYKDRDSEIRKLYECAYYSCDCVVKGER